MGETRLDETRLREIERQYPAGLSRVGDELIAALRDAWRERDELVAHVQRLTPVNEIVERAARAKEEAFKWQESWKNEHALRLTDEMRFSSLREAAEAVIRAYDGPTVDVATAISGRISELRRALSACAKDPAR